MRAHVPSFSNAYVDLIARKGEEHEKNFLEALRAEGHELDEVGLGDDRSFAAAAETTAAAMRAGAKYIYQAVFLIDGWHGIADFLERIDRPSALGDWSYQVLDTKLARHPRPEHALQLCFYSHALEQIQKIAPEMAYVVLGTRDRFPIRIANVSAYFRRLQDRFRDAITARSQTAPYPCDHCLMCGYQSICEERWEREDHLVRVAGIRRDQVNRLATAELRTLTALAQARPDTRVPKIPAATFEGLHDQAALQFESQRADKIAYLKLPVEDGRGFATLPQRSTGDVILDLEGHPFFEPARGLTFLFGIVTVDGDKPRYRCILGARLRRRASRLRRLYRLRSCAPCALSGSSRVPLWRLRTERDQTIDGRVRDAGVRGRRSSSPKDIRQSLQHFSSGLKGGRLELLAQETRTSLWVHARCRRAVGHGGDCRLRALARKPRR